VSRTDEARKIAAMESAAFERMAERSLCQTRGAGNRHPRRLPWTIEEAKPGSFRRHDSSPNGCQGNCYNAGPTKQGLSMTISMYSASVPVFIHTLTNLNAILSKAAAHAQAKKIDDSVLLNTRLFPDMLPFTKQVDIATDFARGTAARLAGLETPVFEDNEKTFAELMARVERTLDYLRTFKPEQIDGSEAREIVRPLGGQPKKFTGINYLLQFALPNFYFHATTTYAILRHSGIEVGKMDFLGALDLVA